jgi:hypothetical protein
MEKHQETWSKRAESYTKIRTEATSVREETGKALQGKKAEEKQPVKKKEAAPRKRIRKLVIVPQETEGAVEAEA